MERFREDFDRIAGVSRDGADRNTLYHDLLLEHVPSGCRRALDVGCGSGTLARRLAGRSEHVLGVDLSPRMIDRAREESAGISNVDYLLADVTAWDWPEAAFDCVASVAALHHLPFEETLLEMRRALRPGGVLLVLDLFESEGIRDRLLDVVALPVSVMLRLIRQGRLRPPVEERRAWEAHAHHDTYPTLARVRRICADRLPGARVRRHLLWRYSIVWRKPAGSDGEVPG